MRDQLRDLLLDGSDEDAAPLRPRGGTPARPGRDPARPAVVVRLPGAARAVAGDPAVMVARRACWATRSEAGSPSRSRGRRSRSACGPSRRRSSREVRRRLAEERGVEKVARTAVKPLTEQVDFLRASRGDLVGTAAPGVSAGPPAGHPADGAAPARPRRAARLPAHRARLAGHRRRPDGDQAPPAQAAQARAGRALRHQRVGRGFLALHPDAHPRAARAVLQGARVRLHRHLRRDHRLPARRRPRRRRWPASRRRPTSSGSTGTATTGTRSRSSPSATRTPSPPRPRCSCSATGATTTARRALATLKRLVGQARHAYWLNPEPRSYWGSADSAAPDYAPLVDEMVECRNVEQLSEFITRLLPV